MIICIGKTPLLGNSSKIDLPENMHFSHVQGKFIRISCVLFEIKYKKSELFHYSIHIRTTSRVKLSCILSKAQRSPITFLYHQQVSCFSFFSLSHIHLTLYIKFFLILQKASKSSHYFLLSSIRFNYALIFSFLHLSYSTH